MSKRFPLGYYFVISTTETREGGNGHDDIYTLPRTYKLPFQGPVYDANPLPDLESLDLDALLAG